MIIHWKQGALRLELIHHEDHNPNADTHFHVRHIDLFRGYSPGDGGRGERNRVEHVLTPQKYCP